MLFEIEPKVIVQSKSDLMMKCKTFLPNVTCWRNIQLCDVRKSIKSIQKFPKQAKKTSPPWKKIVF